MPASSAQPGKSFYLPQLDGLRFIAFLLVYIHNSQIILPGPIYKAINEYGWVGVDLFFCLSGYLITRLLREEFERNGTIDIRSFYLWRILRISPFVF